MNKDNKGNEIEIDLMEIFGLLISKIWMIILSALVFGIIALCYCKFFVTPMYSSTAQIAVRGSSTAITSLADLQIGTQLTQDYIVVVKSRPVVEKVIENLDLDMTYEQLLSKTSVINQADTRILSISVTNPDPYLAKQIVDQYALVSRTRIAELMDIAEPGIVEAGHISSHKDSPNTKKNTVIAALIGAVLCAGIIIVRFLLDDTIKSSDDIEKYLGINTLAILPVDSAMLSEQEREILEKKNYKKKRKKLKKEAKKNK
ncbi:MAG: polysaccharide export protein [Lachnospiraceae bacterium]|nr:polysaccharide export protein [Lachnospiraceae bacterium]